MNNEYLKIIGSNIKQKRLELNMTQQELAEKCGLKTKSAISYLETGRRDTTTETFQLIAKALDCSVGYLLGYEEETTPAEISADVIYNYLVKCGYVEPGQDLSDEDLQFLQAQLEAIASWLRSKKDLRK